MQESKIGKSYERPFKTAALGNMSKIIINFCGESISPHGCIRHSRVCEQESVSPNQSISSGGLQLVSKAFNVS